MKNQNNIPLMSPKVDFVFKRIFGNPEMPEILISFLNKKPDEQGA